MQTKKGEPIKITFQRNGHESENQKSLTKEGAALPVLSDVLLALARRFSEDPDCSAVRTEDSAATAAAL